MNVAILMAKGASQRTTTHNKNIVDICGKPLLGLPLETLKLSGIFSHIVISTDSDEVAQIALDNGATDVVKREAGWDRYYSYCFSVEQSLLKFEETTGVRIQHCGVIAGNSVFIRPSWFRAALDIIRRYDFRDEPIHVVSPDQQFVSMGLFKIQRFSSAGFANTFLLQHKGIICDIDTDEDIQLARQIRQSIIDGHISYPMEENIHTDLLAHHYHSHYKGLTTKLKKEITPAGTILSPGPGNLDHSPRLPPYTVE